MNILFVDQFSEWGGAQLCLRDLLPAIVARGWCAHLALPGEGPVADAFRGMGFPVHLIPLTAYSNGHKTGRDLMRFSVDTPMVAQALRSLIRQHQIDLLYVNGPRPLPAAAIAGMPLLFHAHSRPQQATARLTVALALKYSRAEVIAVSRFAASGLQPYITESRVHIVYNGVPEIPYRSRTGDLPWRIGLVGRISPEKGHFDFIDAARLLARDRSDRRFIVYGAPEQGSTRYAERVMQVARGAPVEFAGWRDSAAIFSQLDILAVPSCDDDAAPRVVLDAMSAGVPVVAYPSGGIPELIDRDTGCLTEARTSTALAGGITRLIDDPAWMQRLASAARDRWARMFRLERYQQEIVGLLERYVPQGRGAAKTVARQGWH